MKVHLPHPTKPQTFGERDSWMSNAAACRPVTWHSGTGNLVVSHRVDLVTCKRCLRLLDAASANAQPLTPELLAR